MTAEHIDSKLLDNINSLETFINKCNLQEELRTFLRNTESRAKSLCMEDEVLILLELTIAETWYVCENACFDELYDEELD